MPQVLICRQTDNLGTGTHLYGLRVNQDLSPKHCYNSAMFRRVSLCVIAAMCSTVCRSQAPTPLSTYTLHTNRESRRQGSLIETATPPSSTLTVAPDDALIVLIPQSDRSWILKRLTNWNSANPQEQTLTLTGGSKSGGDSWVEADLAVNPSGSYLIVRITTRQGPVGPSGRDWESRIVLVDLRSFGIASSFLSTDPLIAGSQWQFNPRGLLITKGLAKRLQVKSPTLTTVTDSYGAAALSLPDMRATVSCVYDEILELRDGDTGWVTKIAGQAKNDCAAVLDAANVSSVDSLPGSNEALDRVAKLLKSSCTITAISKDERFALYSCATGHPTAWDTVKTDSRSSLVLSEPDGKTVAAIPLPFKQAVIAALSETGDQNYLLLLRDGITLETYRLP